MPQITVIIPYVKSSEGIERALHSVLNQNYTDFYINVVCAKELTCGIIDERIKYTSSHSSHISHLLNKGILETNTEYCCFLNENDLLLYNSLEERYGLFLKKPETVAVYGLNIDTDGDFNVKDNINYQHYVEKICNNNHTFPKNSILSILRGETSPSVSSIMIKTDAAKQLLFSPDKEIAYTQEMLIRAFKSFRGNIKFCEQPLFISSVEDKEILSSKKALCHYIKETLATIDVFLAELQPNSYLKKIRHELFRGNYYRFLSMSVSRFPHDYWIRLYLTVSYLKKLKEHNIPMPDFFFLTLMLNSLKACGKTHKESRKAF